MILYFGIFAAIVIWVFRQPAAAVGALLCTYGLEQWSQSQSPFFWSHQWLTNLMTAGLLCGALLVRASKGKGVITPLTREYWVMTALYTMALVSITWSINTEATWDKFSDSAKYIAIFGFLMPLAISNRDDLRASLFTLITVGFALCLMLLMSSSWADRRVVFKQGAMIGVEGLSGGNPLAVATLGGQIALAALLMNFRGAARFWQVLRYAVVGVGFALAVKSGSRGQAVAIVICALVFLPYSRRFRDLKGFVGLAGALCVTCVMLALIFNAIAGDSSVDKSIGNRWSVDSFVGSYEEGRVETSRILLARWVDEGPIRWVIGIGSSASYDPSVLGMYPHVVFAEVLGELGLVGWFILWLVPIHAYRNLRDLWGFVKDDPEDRGLVAALAAIFLFDVILSFKQGSLLGVGNTFGLSVIMGRLLWGYRQELATYEQLNAGGYAMTDDDWADEDPDASDPMLPELALAR